MSRSLLAQAGRLVQRHVHPPAPERSATATRVRLLAELERHRNRKRQLFLAAAAAAALAAVVVVLWLRPAERDHISFTVGPDATPGQIGAYVTPPADEPLELQFSEGSVIALDPATRARVTQTTGRGAIVLVETGHARVDVVHHPDTDWQVLAGPYTIKVRGTSFDVGFEESSQTLEVVMRSGVVSVEGPGITSPLQIGGAQRFVHTASSTAATTAVSDASATARESARAAPEPESTPAGATSEPPDDFAATASTAVAPSVSPSESWSELVARGEYHRVLEAADVRGIDQALATGSPVDLMALGNAARFSGRSGVASRAYQATRERFARSPQAAQAAFLLGRMAEGGSPAAAVSWYDRYVAEAPTGPFVAEALGRRMVALKRSGNADAARAAAHDYLERFPSGPYAGVAREMTAP